MEYNGTEELWDIYDENRKPLGLVIIRGGGRLQLHHYHLVCEAILYDLHGNILITRRSPEKAAFGMKWEVTAGSAMSGETTKEAAIREVMEETGIDISNCKMVLLASERVDNIFRDSYGVLVPNLSLDDIRLQPGETIDAAIENQQEIFLMIRDGDFGKEQGNRLISLIALGNRMLLGKTTEPGKKNLTALHLKQASVPTKRRGGAAT